MSLIASLTFSHRTLAFLRLYFSFPVFQGKWSFQPYKVCSAFFIVSFFLAAKICWAVYLLATQLFFITLNIKNIFFHSAFEYMYTINSFRINLKISQFLWRLLHLKHLKCSNVRCVFVLLSFNFNLLC